MTRPSWRERARSLRQEVYALGFALRDPRVPWYAKASAGLVVALAFSPIDIVPDFVPILGYLDDLVVIPVGIWFTLRLIPVDVMADCRLQAAARLETARPGGVWGAVIVAALWLILAAGSGWLAWSWWQGRP